MPKSTVTYKHLIMVINEDRFFLSHRREVAEGARDAGWKVTLLSKDTGSRREAERSVDEFVELPINPTGMNPVQELHTLDFLTRYYRRNRDAVVHHVGLKNILWGGVASRISGVRGVVDAVSGLGVLFGKKKNSMATKGVARLIRLGMRKDNLRVIFQNHDDESLFETHGFVTPDKGVFIKGSGVNLEEFSYAPEPETNPIQVIFTGRMLREKGVPEFMAAAELLRPRWEGKVEFLLCGGLSTNPAAMSESDLVAGCDGKYIKWLGHRDDVRDLLRKSAVMVFPSYYREGVPKSLIEASATGRPILTTDSFGCRDTVVEGVNGFKVSPCNPGEIASRLELLLSDRGLRHRMGLESRRIAERDYDVRDVVKRHLEVYEELLRDSPGTMTVK